MKKVAIAEKMQKFYGIGMMLHPDKEMIEELLKQVPAGKVVTLDALCRKLADDYGTNVTCPMRTGNFVKTITKAYSDSNASIPFWRVIRSNYMLVNSPSTELCAEYLKEEGFQISQNSKGEFKVQNVEDRLFTF